MERFRQTGRVGGRRRGGWGVLGVLLLTACAGWGDGGAMAGEAPVVRRFEFSASAAEVKSYGYAPAFLDIDNDLAQLLRITIATREFGGSNYEFSLRTELPENTKTRLEVPVPVGRGNFYTVTLRREHGEEMTDTFNLNNIFYRSTPLVELWAVNSYRFSDLLDHVGKKARGGTSVEVTPRQVEDLPAHWQSYAGVPAIPVLHVRDIVRLSPAQRRALSDWVRWGSGRLWLVAATQAEAFAAAQRDFGLACVDAGAPGRKVAVRRVMTGEVWACAEADFTGWGTLSFRQMPGLVSEFRTDALTHFNNGLLQRLGGLSAAVIAALLAGLGLLLGPVNYLYIRRARSPLLFYVTTPALALLGVGMIVGYSVFHEGFSVKYKEKGLLLHESGSENGLVVAARGIYSGLGAGRLTYPADALLYPFRQSNDTGLTFSAEVGAETVLTGGWVTPRKPSGVLSLIPQRVRMSVTVTREGERYYAVNTLNHPLRRLAVGLPGGGCAWAESVPSGERRELRVEKDRRALTELYSAVALAFPGVRAGDFAVVAECEGLPYLDAGNPGGDKVEGAYFYAASAPWPVPAAPAAGAAAAGEDEE